MAESDVLIPKTVSANRNALAEIRDSGIVPGFLPWHPAEVCNLLRWDVQTDEPTSRIKLFGCWILIRAYVQIESKLSGMVDDGDEHTIVALTEAALDLGQDFPQQAAQFLYWAYLALLGAGGHRHQARPFYLFGLLITAASAPRLMSEEDLSVIADRLHNEEARVRTELLADDSYASRSSDFPLWLLGLAGDDLNGFQRRCYNLVQGLILNSKLQIPQGPMRKVLMDNMLSRWKSITPES